MIRKYYVTKVIDHPTYILNIAQLDIVEIEYINNDNLFILSKETLQDIINTPEKYPELTK